MFDNFPLPDLPVYGDESDAMPGICTICDNFGSYIANIPYQYSDASGWYAQSGVDLDEVICRHPVTFMEGY